MLVTDIYPSPDDLFALELRVLDFLRDEPFIAKNYPYLVNDLNKFIGINKSSHSGFHFFSHVDVCHRQLPIKRNGSRVYSNLSLIIGVDIRQDEHGNYSNISYCLGVVRTLQRNRRAIWRKFHFDLTVPGAQRRQAHPISHLQYGGELNHSWRELGFRDSQTKDFQSQLSEPRVQFCPMSLALIFDLIFREFPDQETVEFRSSREWIQIVRNHEDAVLLPYYRKCVDTIGENRAAVAGSRFQTMSDIFYID